jgi:DNA replication and repair protein RecF
VLLRQLNVAQFRNYEYATFNPAPGLTVVSGRNGQGKTNLVEAVAYLSSLESFRAVPADVLIRDGAESSQLVAHVDVDGRPVDVDVTLARRGHHRATVNGQRLVRTRDLLGVLRVTVFTPDDLELIKGGPALRRGLLDDMLVLLRPAWDLTRSELERVLRQRSVLLKQIGPRAGGDDLATLDVWDTRLADVGTMLADARRRLVEELEPWVIDAYHRISGIHEPLRLRYDAPWMSIGLAESLARARVEDLRRGTTSVGPHRDELRVELRDSAARTHGSQGEQRCLALALRLGGHELVRERHGTSPVLVLDDVFSELDPQRSAALLDSLPEGQVLLTTAEGVPVGARPDLVVEVDHGCLMALGRD